MVEFSVTAMDAPIGAEVSGLDLTQVIDDFTREKLTRYFSEHCMLVFRDQRMSPEQMLTASQLFGEVFPYRPADRLRTGFHTVPGVPLVHYISNEDTQPDGSRAIPGNGWHMDLSSYPQPPKAIVLYAVELPDSGGDTQFADMRRAYDELPDAVARRIDGLLAIHPFRRTLNGPRPRMVSSAVVHPLVRTHPDSGRKALFLNPSSIKGVFTVPDEEAMQLLDELLTHASQPKYEYRHKWRPGDFVMWDNRCILHRANPDYDMNQRRKHFRIMLKGGVPF